MHHYHPYYQFDRVKSELPQSLCGWHLYMSNDTIELSLIRNAPPEPSVVKTTLTVHKDLQWMCTCMESLYLRTMTSSVSSQLTLKVGKRSKSFAQIYRKQLYVKETVNLTLLTC